MRLLFNVLFCIAAIFNGILHTDMKRFRLLFLIFTGILLLLAMWIAYALFFPSSGNDAKSIRIRKSWDMATLANNLKDSGIIQHADRFVKIANFLGYKQTAPCLLEIAPNTSVFQLVKLLKMNRKQTVDIVIKGSMTNIKLAELISSKLEIDKDSFLMTLESDEKLSKYGVYSHSWHCIFIPNTYNFYVATELNEFLEKMKLESDKFWENGRMEKANKQQLNPLQVMTIASIVSKESNRTDEYEKIAGVYINRFRKGMLLQADPTVVFARGTSGLVSYADLKIQSPYNTYIYKGLPPGPICIPSVSAVESVLNYSNHSYYYFVASADFSGYHSFAENYNQHLKYVDDLRKARKKREAEKSTN